MNMRTMYIVSCFIIYKLYKTHNYCSKYSTCVPVHVFYSFCR